MSKTKSIILLIISFLILGYVVFIQRYANVQIDKYEDIEVVKKYKAIQNGWVPAIIPNSAYNIAETHDSDANTLFGSFNYKEQDEAKLMEHLTINDDVKNILEWENFLFTVDKEQNQVKYRNKPIL